jgi:hypothetical protein
MPPQDLWRQREQTLPLLKHLPGRKLASHATDYELARTAAAATIAEEQALMMAASASVLFHDGVLCSKPRRPLNA